MYQANQGNKCVRVEYIYCHKQKEHSAKDVQWMLYLRWCGALVEIAEREEYMVAGFFSSVTLWLFDVSGLPS